MRAQLQQPLVGDGTTSERVNVTRPGSPDLNRTDSMLSRYSHLLLAISLLSIGLCVCHLESVDAEELSAIKVLCFIVDLVGVLLLCSYYRLLPVQMQDSSISPWSANKIWTRLLLEIVCMLIQPLPGVASDDEATDAQELLSLLSFCKLYHVARVTRDRCLLYRKRREIFSVFRKRKMFVPRFDWWLAFRYFVYVHRRPCCMISNIHVYPVTDTNWQHGFSYGARESI